MGVKWNNPIDAAAAVLDAHYAEGGNRDIWNDTKLIIEAYEAARTEHPDEKTVLLAKARPWPGIRNVDLMQIATNAFCRHNPAGYNWSGQALEAACKAYHKAAIPEQPVDTSDIAHKLELNFPQISLSALSDIIEYFRPYLRSPKRESGSFTLKDIERAYDAGWQDNESGFNGHDFKRYLRDNNVEGHET